MRLRRAHRTQSCTWTHSPAAVRMAIALSSNTLPQVLAEVSAADPELASLIIQHGPPLKLCASSGRCFPMLVKSILYQQLAGAAAATIHGRFLATCGVADGEDLTPAHVLAADPQQLRAAGLSERKLQYVTELSVHFQDGRLSEDTLRGMSDQELLASLTRVRGIGPWTVDMFAMFHLGRPDVLPVGDLGVRKGLQHLHQLKELPSPARMMELTAHWQPWRSIGSYYMWRVAEAAPRATPGTSKGRKRAQASQAQAAAAAGAEAADTAAAPVGASTELMSQVPAAAAAAAATAAANGGSKRPRKRGGETDVGAAAAASDDVDPDVAAPETPPLLDKGGRVGGSAAAAAVGAQALASCAGRMVTRSVASKQQQQQQHMQHVSHATKNEAQRLREAVLPLTY